MATYKAKARGYCGAKVREVGEEFQFDGVPGSWMEPICKDAKEKVEALKVEKNKSAKPAK